MFFGGGIVIKMGDETIGAIGASGAPAAKLDDNCARAGVEKIRDRLKYLQLPRSRPTTAQQ